MSVYLSMSSSPVGAQIPQSLKISLQLVLQVGIELQLGHLQRECCGRRVAKRGKPGCWVDRELRAEAGGDIGTDAVEVVLQSGLRHEAGVSKKTRQEGEKTSHFHDPLVGDVHAKDQNHGEFTICGGKALVSVSASGRS